MALVPDQKFSTFQNGGDLEVGDIIVGLRGGLNTRFTYTGELPVGVVIPIANGGTGANNAADARTNLGLGTMATQNASAVAITGGTIAGVTISGATITASTAALTSGSVAAAPISGTDITNKTYVDSMIGGTVASVSGTLNRITSTGGVNPVIDISASYIGQASITTLGTIGTGVWNGTGITVPFGGTGLASATAYAVLCGGTTSTGAFQSIASVGTSGQVLTSNGAGALPTFQAASGSGTVNSGSQNQIAWYAANGTAVSGLATANNGILVTSAGGVPSIGNTVGAGLTMPSITFNTTTGIVGTTTNDNAAAGSVGQLISSVIASGSAVTFTSTTVTNLTSISLTAGDWFVYGNIGAGATTVTNGAGWISTSSATLPDNSLYAFYYATVDSLRFAVPCVRISIGSTTTVYLSGRFAGTGTIAVSGGIYARRVR
jgi:hypothetical protein